MMNFRVFHSLRAAASWEGGGPSPGPLVGPRWLSMLPQLRALVDIIHSTCTGWGTFLVVGDGMSGVLIVAVHGVRLKVALLLSLCLPISSRGRVPPPSLTPTTPRSCYDLLKIVFLAAGIVSSGGHNCFLLRLIGCSMVILLSY